MPRALMRTAFIFLTADQCLISMFMTRRVNVCGSRVFCSVWKSVSQAWLYFLHVSLIILSKEQWHCVVLLLQLWAPCRIKITLFSKIQTLNMQEKSEAAPELQRRLLEPHWRPWDQAWFWCLCRDRLLHARLTPWLSLKHFIVQALELTSSGERSTHLSPCL